MPRSLLTTVLLFALAMPAIAGEDSPCPRFAKAPVIDAQLADWAGRPALVMTEPAVDDLKVESAQLGWDASHLYLAVQVKDHHLVNAKEAGPQLTGGDAVELRLVAPSGEILRLVVAPTTSTGKPGLYLAKAPGPKLPSTVIATSNDPSVADPSGVAWALNTQADSWTVEVAVPKAACGLSLSAGAVFPFVVVVWDRDATDRDEWAEWRKRSESSNQKKMPDEWLRLTLAD